ncbi:MULTISPECIES: hydroxyacid dehydrogenase [Streptomyces]|uniref:Hydroxyacid dehydrogenase n=1 Tax=Streptomyces caniscabiei TaxID=2746961 RepID=A0ABU4MWG9_9ACTN|nr:MULTISPECIES: hydroxyacid dehydrogenase [Streptomyces]MBE4734556.1 hydroxyacid dehydrogenase [Streptomyces caniscabiei]MBE4755427.1 hydroxyacid dehydrogenase [Streptomyces caniscabiei]MBE4772449.1 hydroxyacid dehydrogenase [Streptomyces caniscabiei]MBE4783289.1 hydroxyacid dehydrogenase [Streptomyces caniscabiei]MBE4792593.1 hydroxyacid dehydrogenase [Streptomyces caniscabiei]
MPERPRALFAMTAENVPQVFPPDVLARLRETVDIDPALIAEDFTDPRIRAALAGTEVLITGWGCPRIDEPVLDAAPGLRALLHSAGSVKGFVTPAVWERGIAVSTAAAANALPVAEYTLAMILLAGKDILGRRERLRAERVSPGWGFVPGIGNHGRRVGVVGASRIGRRVIELLRPFDLRVSLTDPYVDEAGAAALGVPLLPLDELLRTSDIVTVHAPDTPETHRLIDRRALSLMPDGAALINTARGALVDHDALVDELRAGRLSAVLDVTDPEPLPADSPLLDLPNAFVTPHLAGSQGNEVARLGLAVTEEAERLAAGEEPAYALDRGALERMA